MTHIINAQTFSIVKNSQIFWYVMQPRQMQKKSRKKKQQGKTEK
jgi:hypothetical protein